MSSNLFCAFSVEGAFDIGIDIGVGGVVRVGNGDQGGQVKDEITAGHGFPNTIGVAHIPRKDFEIIFDLWWRMIQPAPGIKRIIQDKGSDRAALPDKFFRQVGTDKPIGAGNQNSFVGDIHYDIN